MTRFLLIFALFAAAPSFAEEQPASEASVRALMAASKTKDILDTVWDQLDGSMEMAIKAATKGDSLNAEQQKAVDNMRTKMTALFREEMGWEILEPLLIDVYRKSFTQKELDGMLKFYRSEAGQAMVAKMPVVMKNSNEAMMSRVQAMVPRMQDLQKDFIAELKKGEGK